MSSGTSRRADYVIRHYAQLTMAIVVPVSICIFCSVWCVIYLTPLTGATGSAASSGLPLVSDENAQTTSGGKAESSLINVLVIIAFVVGITFLMALLYKYRCMKILFGWLFLSAVIVYFMMGWMFIDLFCTRYQIPYDLITLGILLWNFGIVGILAVFYRSSMRMQQAYLVFTSVMIAWTLARVPEWTTWALLVGIALWDIVAVLWSRGPLQALVREAQERDEPIPGFVYDSNSQAGNMEDGTAGRQQSRRRRRDRGATGSPRPSGTGGNEDQPTDPESAAESEPSTRQSNDAAGSNERQEQRQSSKTSHSEHDENHGGGRKPSESTPLHDAPQIDISPEMMREGFKLGLGDFIFYSLLVSRAAAFSTASWMICYTSILLGMFGTFLCLLFAEKIALPALPISIFCGVIMYFVTRYAAVDYVRHSAALGMPL